MFYHRNCEKEIPKIDHCGILSSYTHCKSKSFTKQLTRRKVNPTLIVSPTFIFLNDEWLNDDEVILRLNSFSFCIMHTLLGKPIYLSKGQHCTPDLLHTACKYTQLGTLLRTILGLQTSIPKRVENAIQSMCNNDFIE